MSRRDFLKMTGAASALAMAGFPGRASLAESPMDLGRLKSRNRDRSTVVAQHGIVCTAQPLATMAGIDVLKSGGNCIDAAICANAMLGLTEAAACGMGGDLFAILWIEKDKKLYGLNASGRAPYAWSLDEANKREVKKISRTTPLSWSVPGCVSGWGMLSERFGKKSLADCLAASVGYAHQGFPLSPIISTYFSAWPSAMAPHMADVYHPDGKVPRYGEIFKNPLLGKAYEAIGKDGPAAYYEGYIAEAIVAKSKELDGVMAMKDLADHTANWVEPVSTNYRGYDVWEIPPNGQGIAALQMLNILENFDLGELKPNSVQHLHLLAEAKKLAFEDRAIYYADPEFADVPLEWLISKEYGKKRAKLIDEDKARRDVPYGDPKLDSDTTFLTAADSEGNMISLIQSNYSGFGSTICPDGVGFVMQNRGEAFSLDPKHRNHLEPHKRPFHTIIPAFMTKDEKPLMAFGVMGGDFQPQGHSQIVMNIVDFGMSVQQAGDQPRLGHNGSSSPWGGPMKDGGTLEFEHGISDSVKVGLAEMGHNISSKVNALGGYQSVWREDDPLVYFGGSDPRKDGCSIGW
jgi:gamma-glutamyltranspeptidase/glutathione hydrolase